MNGKKAIQTLLGSKLADACLADFASCNLSFFPYLSYVVNARVVNAHHHHHHHHSN
jgi:hypothetical protein